MELLVKSGVPVTPNMTIAELEAAAEALAEEKNKNVFFRADDGELVIEGRQIKAMLKEAVAIFYAYSGRTAAAFGKDVNPYGKNAKSWLAERVFVAETLVGLGVKEPSGTFLFVGHTSGPQGQVSSMTNLEYVDQPTLTFHIGVLKGLIKPQHWREVWAECELLGLGAKRSQSWGQFKVMDFSQLDEEEAKPIWKNVYFGPFNRRVSPSAPITIEWPEPPAAPEPVDVVDGAVDGAVVVQAVD
jgi:hypothetical protein